MSSRSSSTVVDVAEVPQRLIPAVGLDSWDEGSIFWGPAHRCRAWGHVHRDMASIIRCICLALSTEISFFTPVRTTTTTTTNHLGSSHFGSSCLWSLHSWSWCSAVFALSTRCPQCCFSWFRSENCEGPAVAVHERGRCPCCAGGHLGSSSSSTRSLTRPLCHRQCCCSQCLHRQLLHNETVATCWH